MEPLRVAELVEVESVRCLDCSRIYAKPRAGGTISTNPGCPDCGYVGWAIHGAVREAPPHGRSGVGLPLRRLARPH